MKLHGQCAGRRRRGESEVLRMKRNVQCSDSATEQRINRLEENGVATDIVGQRTAQHGLRTAGSVM